MYVGVSFIMKTVTAMCGETERRRLKNHEVYWSNPPVTTKTFRDFRLRPPCWWDLRSSGILSSGKVKDYHSTLRNIPERADLNKNFIVIRDLMYFTICFGQFGHLQVLHTMYEVLGRKLSAESTIKRNTMSFLHKIVIIYKVMLYIYI
jgi:lantibiotic modifying enzyme